MKKIIYLVSIFTCITGQASYADYQCEGYNNQDKLTVLEQHITRLGNMSATLVSGNLTQHYFGNLTKEDGGVYKKKLIEFYPYQGDSLTIVSRPRNCGRVECDPKPGEIITASLKVGGTETYFSCHETDN